MSIFPVWLCCIEAFICLHGAVASPSAPLGLGVRPQNEEKGPFELCFQRMSWFRNAPVCSKYFMYEFNDQERTDCPKKDHIGANIDLRA